MLAEKQRSKKTGFTLIELLVVVAIIALLISILLPSLAQAKAMAKTVLCGSHQRAAYAGWTMYAGDFNGKYMAMWDRTNPTPWASTGKVSLQVPYTMFYYLMGESLPGSAYGYNGWYNPYSHAYGGFGMMTGGIKDGTCPAYHCPELEDKMGDLYETPFQANMLSYSIMFPRVYNHDRSAWEYQDYFYGKPDLYTHPGSTGLLTCLNGSIGAYNAWCGYENAYPVNPHNEKANYLFADGHIELLPETGTDVLMWTPMWERGADY